jgi:hypothetical protein
MKHGPCLKKKENETKSIKKSSAEKMKNKAKVLKKASEEITNEISERGNNDEQKGIKGDCHD